MRSYLFIDEEAVPIFYSLFLATSYNDDPLFNAPHLQYSLVSAPFFQGGQFPCDATFSSLVYCAFCSSPMGSADTSDLSFARIRRVGSYDNHLGQRQVRSRRTFPEASNNPWMCFSIYSLFSSYFQDFKSQILLQA